MQATRDTELIVLDRRRFAQIGAQDTRMGVTVMRALALAIADRLRHANAELREMREA